MTPEQIISELKSRGERNIQFNENGTIISMHGNTVNYWMVVDGELMCYDCKTIGY
jgi:hypothetical protein